MTSIGSGTEIFQNLESEPISGLVGNAFWATARNSAGS